MENSWGGYRHGVIVKITYFKVIVIVIDGQVIVLVIEIMYLVMGQMSI